MMTPQEALDFLDGARFANYSGQIIAEHADKNKDFILCDLTCACSEVANKNADEYGEALAVLLNGSARLRAALAPFADIAELILGDLPNDAPDNRHVSAGLSVRSLRMARELLGDA
jgi:hypothetical protein